MSYKNRRLLTLSAKIVSAHAANNALEHGALPAVIRSVFNTLIGLDVHGAVVSDGTPAPERHDHHSHDHHGDAAVPDGQSASGHYDHTGYIHPTYGQTVFADHLICMEDGLSMKMLKRHLLMIHGITPDEYRAKWALPDTYPMVAAEYAKLRSTLAYKSGLGLKPEDRPTKPRKSRAG